MQRWPPAQAAQCIQHKHRDVGIKRRAVVSHAMVLAVHRAGRGAQTAAAGVFEAFAGCKGGLFADYARAFNFFGHAVGIVDVPAAGDELRGDVARIRDGDGVGKAEHAHARRRLRRQILRADGDGELGTRHIAMLTLSQNAVWVIQLRFKAASTFEGALHGINQA
jgi:hypothetical protein